MKRVLFAIISVGFICTAFVFGGGNQEASSSEEEIELIVWSTLGQSPLFVEAFGDVSNRIIKEKYSNVSIKMELVEYGGYQEKFLSAFAAGTGPDIFNGRAQIWAEDGGLHPVAVALPDDIAKLWDKEIAQVHFTTGYFKGKRYGFPVETDQNMLLYYNKDHFAEAGLDVNSPPETVEEFIKIAQMTTKTDETGKIIRAGYAPRHLGSPGGPGQKFMSFIFIFGGQAIADDLSTTTGYINGQGSLDAFQFYYDLVHKYKVTTLSFGSCEETFQQGLATMIFREGWFARDTDDKAPNINYGIAQHIYVPSIGNISPNMISSSWSWLINKDTKYKDICFDLFEGLCDVDADVEIHRSADYPPSMQASFSSDWFLSLKFADAINEFQKKTAPNTPQLDLKEWGLLREIIGEEIVGVLSGTLPEVGVNNAAKRMNEILDGLD